MLDTLNTPAQVQLLKKVRCVLYISVPSNGSELAGLASWLSNNPQFKSLSPANAADFLQAVEADWDEILLERTSASPFPMTFSAYEKLSTKGFTIVPELYSTRSDAPLIVFDKDHFDIVKPEDRNSEVYEWARSRVLQSSALKVEARKSGIPTASSSEPCRVVGTASSEIVARIYFRGSLPQSPTTEASAKPYIQELFYDWILELRTNHDAQEVSATISDPISHEDRIRVLPDTATFSDAVPKWMSGFNEPSRQPDYYLRTASLGILQKTCQRG